MVSIKMNRKAKIPEYAIKAKKFFRNSPLEKARKIRVEEVGSTFGIYKSARLEEIAKELDMFFKDEKEYRLRFRRIATVSGDVSSPEQLPKEVR